MKYGTKFLTTVLIYALEEFIHKHRTSDDPAVKQTDEIECAKWLLDIIQTVVYDLS